MTQPLPVKGYLLDTSVALFALGSPERLSRAVRTIISRGPNVLSVVTFWEATLKAAKGKLDIGDPPTWWEGALTQLAATSLPLRPEHIAELQNLPALHNDPFDRVLVAQAASESLTFITTDAEIRRYASERIRVLG